MKMQNPFGYRQSKPGPGRVRAARIVQTVKRFEDLRKLSLWYACTAISHDDDRFVCVYHRIIPEVDFNHCSGGRKPDRVAENIFNRTPQKTGISEHSQICLLNDVYTASSLLSFKFSVAGNARNKLRQIHTHQILESRGSIKSGHCQQPPNHLIQTLQIDLHAIQRRVFSSMAAQ